MVHIFGAHPTKEHFREVLLTHPEMETDLRIIYTAGRSITKLAALKSMYNIVSKKVHEGAITTLGGKKAQYQALGPQMTVAKNIIDSIEERQLREEIKIGRIQLAATILAATAKGEKIENLKDVIALAKET